MTKSKNNDTEILEVDLDTAETLEAQDVYEDEELEEVYKPISQLHVPQEAKDAFRQKGYELHWIRINVPGSGELDSKNIIMKEHDGYEPVRREEIPGLKKTMKSFFGEKLSDGAHGLYVIKDVALFKISHKRLEAKRRYVSDRTASRSKAIINDLRKNKVLPSTERGEGWKIETNRPKSSRDTQFG